MKILRLAVLLANFLPLSLASEDETLYGLDSAVERYFASKTASPSPMYSPMAHSSAKGEHSHTNNWVVLVRFSQS